MPTLSMHMSLIKSGLLSIIPPLYRKIIRGRSDLRVLKIVLLYLLYRLSPIPNIKGRAKGVETS